MATTTPASDPEHSIVSIESSADADGAGGTATASGEMEKKESSEEARTGVLRRESSELRRKENKLKWLDNIVLCIAFLEWAGNAVGTVAFLWATVVLLGGFCSLLSRADFWFSTVMIFVEATRVFIRSDAVNQWLFGSTRAFRWEELSFRPMLVTPMRGNLIALTIGVCISVLPAFQPKIVTSILKVALLVIISQILSRLRGQVGLFLLCVLAIAAIVGGNYGLWKTTLAQRSRAKASKSHQYKTTGLLLAWDFGTMILVGLAALINRCACLKKARALMAIKVITASVLACFPFSQAILHSYYYTCVSISLALVLLKLSTPVRPPPFLVKSRSFQIVDTTMPILLFWSVMFPLPGISLKVAFFMLFSAIVLVLVGNLQIPMAFLQIVLPALRLRSLLGHGHHDYHPLPDGASPNLVASIVVFFMLELCQGSSYIIASFLGLLSLLSRRRMAHALGFKEEWGPKAVNLYFYQAYQARTEKGIFSSENQENTHSLDSFAIKSLGCTSSDEMQIVGLRILDHCLERGDSKSNKKLITEIVKDAKIIITRIIELISCFIDDEYSGDTQFKENTLQETPYLKFVRRIILLTGGKSSVDEEDSDDDTQQKKKEQKEVVCLSLKFVRRLAINSGKIRARFRQELLENPFFLNSLEHILNLEDCQLELWEPVMDIIATLALDDAANQEIGITQSIIPKLTRAFMPDSENNDRSQRMAAGEALANLTIKNTEICWAILLADPDHNLIKNLIDMLKDKNYISIAANLLHNLCANAAEKLKDIAFGANVHLESALPKVMQIILTNKEGKQLEAALCVTSQIGYVIPKCFRTVLISDTNAAALVEKLVDTLNSNREPCPEYPRIRRVLVETVISIVRLCPDPYKAIFREKGAKDALDMVKGTPSRLEKYRVFLDGEGAVAESLPIRDLVDKAKRLIGLTTPAPGA